MPTDTMVQFRKLTENSGETFLHDLFGADAIYEVPYFQRRYKWKKSKVDGFQKDVLRLIDEQDSEGHFLGAVIIQGSGGISRPTLARRYQVIDGQQRLTTILLHLLAAVEVLVETEDEHAVTNAANLFKKYLVVTSSTDGASNFKLHSCGEDRLAMNQLVSAVYNHPQLRGRLAPFALVPLPTGDGSVSHHVTRIYELAKRWMKQQHDDNGINQVELIFTAILLGMTVVQIVVENPLNGPKIFHSLNSRQEPMTVGELVRNDVFARQATRGDSEIDGLYREVWNPFYEAFGPPEQRRFDGYFFPFGLISIGPNVTKSAVYPKLREEWTLRNLTPRQIVDSLSRYQADYLDFLVEGNFSQHPEELASAVANLRSFGLPTSIFSFLMRVSYEARTHQLSTEVAARLLHAVESFLVRRGAFGLEPSGLHAAFKGMWDDISRRMERDEGTEDQYPRYLKESIQSRSTVKWPSDDEFRQSLVTRRLYGSLVTPYILREFDKYLGSDGVSYEGAHVEHVLPQNPTDEWWEHFTPEQHDGLVHTLGNLTLLSEPMNRNLSNGPYRFKREKYAAESRFRVSRKLAAENETWKPGTIKRRGELIAEWAVMRWPE